jgi:hypothetical protein
MGAFHRRLVRDVGPERDRAIERRSHGARLRLIDVENADSITALCRLRRQDGTEPLPAPVMSALFIRVARDILRATHASRARKHRALLRASIDVAASRHLDADRNVVRQRVEQVFERKVALARHPPLVARLVREAVEGRRLPRASHSCM